MCKFVSCTELLKGLRDKNKTTLSTWWHFNIAKIS